MQQAKNRRSPTRRIRFRHEQPTLVAILGIERSRQMLVWSEMSMGWAYRSRITVRITESTKKCKQPKDSIAKRRSLTTPVHPIVMSQPTRSRPIGWWLAGAYDFDAFPEKTPDAPRAVPIQTPIANHSKKLPVAKPIANPRQLPIPEPIPTAISELACSDISLPVPDFKVLRAAP